MEKSLLGLLILCGIFLQGFESSEKKTLDHRVRKKRIIDISHNKDYEVLHQEVPYIVKLVRLDGTIHCTGIILAPRIILTAAHCIAEQTVFVESGRILSRTTNIHSIVVKIIHDDFNLRLKKNDLALAVLDKPIDLSHSHHKSIALYAGRLPPNSRGLVSGWGCSNRETLEFPPMPFSIIVPIISLEDCQRVYHDHETITDKEICTHYLNRTKYCWFGDSGGSLVVNGYLVGVFSWMHLSAEPQFPDVFMNLLDPEYKSWIESKVNHIGQYGRY